MHRGDEHDTGPPPRKPTAAAAARAIASTPLTGRASAVSASSLTTAKPPGPLEGGLAATEQQPQGDGQVEAAGVIASWRTSRSGTAV
jgi:hypothetical protein